VKGVNLIVADALSRAFVCSDNDDDCEQRPRIMNVNAFDKSKRSSSYNMDSASFSICAQFLSDCRSAHNANSTGFPSCSKTAPTPFLLLSTCKTTSVDDKKVNAIHEMPTPTDVAGVKRLCGVVQYMVKFLPDLANEMEPIPRHRLELAFHGSR
jgi:hypothetical protein